MRIFEAIPPRPLKPGQSARITDKDPRELAAKIKSYIQTHRLDSSKLDRLEYQLTHSDLYPLSPAQIEEIKQEIESIKRANDPKVQGYDKIINQVVPIIQTRCSKYLPSLLKSQFFLYRGMGPNEHKNRLAFRANSRVNRIPTDSDVMAQRMFDKTLQELGYTALRSNSIFTSSNLDSAKAFGTAYLIFPTNDATFIWSKTKADIILKINRLEDCRETNMDLATASSLILDQIEELESSGELTNGEKLAIQYTKNTVNKQEISPNDVKHLISFLKQGYAKKFNDYEILDLLNSLYNFSLEEQHKVHMGKFNLDPFKFQDKYKITDKEFPEALNTGHEILINGEYIAVLATFEPMLREALSKNQTVTEAKAIPKPPLLKPGTSKVIQPINKFGSLMQDLENIKYDIRYLKREAEYSKKPLNTTKYNKALKKQASLEKRLNSDQIIDYINKHCGNYVKEMQTAGKLLYRGIKSDESGNNFAFIGNSRKNRKPRDSDKKAAREFDKMLLRAGFEALRSNSIFVTSDIVRTSQYGSRYMIFPLNSATFTYTDHEDLVLHQGSERDWTDYSFGSEELDNNIISKLTEIRTEMKKHYDSIEYSDDVTDYAVADTIRSIVYRLSQVINYRHLAELPEIYKIAEHEKDTSDQEKNYKTIRDLYNFMKPLMPKLKKKLSVDKFKERYKPSNTELHKAIQDGREIYISGYYLALRSEEYKKLIEERILGKKNG